MRASERHASLPLGMERFQFKQLDTVLKSSNVAIGCCDTAATAGRQLSRSIVHPTPTTGFRHWLSSFSTPAGWLRRSDDTCVVVALIGVVFDNASYLFSLLFIIITLYSSKPQKAIRRRRRSVEVPKPESNQRVAVENAKEFSDVSDFILNINNELEDLPLGNYKIATTTEKESTESLV
ncbi:hypothetical protein EVAR_57004_1 [Eumeta japonica]|uniref:Uncharacterized protein n=1 Tax=Eumeta variegata TaxID=151549 RepID=A0A4C1ZQA1_EUMVA|nr:hypothetical protein EVAR_57004_1 [Eumeta japonica]